MLVLCACTVRMHRLSGMFHEQNRMVLVRVQGAERVGRGMRPVLQDAREADMQSGNCRAQPADKRRGWQKSHAIGSVAGISGVFDLGAYPHPVICCRLLSASHCFAGLHGARAFRALPNVPFSHTKHVPNALQHQNKNVNVQSCRWTRMCLRGSSMLTRTLPCRLWAYIHGVARARKAELNVGASD